MIKLLLSFVFVLVQATCWAVDGTMPSLSRGYLAPVEPALVVPLPQAEAVHPASVTPSVPTLTDSEQAGDWNTHFVTDALQPVCGMPAQLNYALDCFVIGLNIDHLVLVAKNVTGDCGIEQIELLFDYFETLDIPRARELIVPLVTGFLESINARVKLKPFFECFPITEDQVSIRIRVRPKRCGFIYPVPGNIAAVTAGDGMVRYDTINSFTYGIDTLRIERLKQAQDLVFGSY